MLSVKSTRNQQLQSQERKKNMFCSSSPKDLAEATSETWTFQFEPERTSCSLLGRACNSRKHKVSRAEVGCQQSGGAPLPAEELRTQQAGG